MEDKKQSKKIILLIVLAVIITGTLTWFITFIAMTFSGSEVKEPLPQKVIQTEVSPNGKVAALLFEDNTGESMNFLGSDSRIFLGIKKNDVTYIISRDLTEGFGTYEGGVFNIKWLNDQQIFIERIIGDQQKNIIFDVIENRWIESN
jgi:hypothetical protein